MRWSRRLEIALWLIGFSLLGGATASFVRSRVYQARQERAFSDLETRIASKPVAYATPLPASIGASTPADADPLVLGRLEIPRIGVSAIVREGDDDATLAVAVGRIPGTARPGERGNMALAGHRDSFFRPLRHIRVDDVIRFHSPGRGYEYRVESTEVVGPREVRVLDPSADATLTLVTCYPFGFVGRAPDRFVVRATQLPQ
ncbi:MAG: class D sortase [Deltaproteobacteria bacterium]|nr:class D sortase [Deltaproteobacteria bacterium]